MLLCCKYVDIKYRNDTLRNITIHKNHIVSIDIGRYARYPDNSGIPTIRFVMLNNNIIEWYFDNEKKRDDCYQSILNSMNYHIV